MELVTEVGPQFAQESCYICHRGEPLVDTGASVEGEGALALCPACIREAAEAAGFTVRATRAKS